QLVVNLAPDLHETGIIVIRAVDHLAAPVAVSVLRAHGGAQPCLDGDKCLCELAGPACAYECGRDPLFVGHPQHIREGPGKVPEIVTAVNISSSVTIELDGRIFQAAMQVDPLGMAYVEILP